MNREHRQGSVAPPGHTPAGTGPAAGAQDGAAGLFRRFRKSLQQANMPAPRADVTPPLGNRAYSHGAYVPLRPLEDVVEQPRAVAPEHLTRFTSPPADPGQAPDPATPLYGEMPLSRFPSQQ